MKAPPVSEFTGEDPEYILDDWLPSLERASLWNSWTEEEKLKQFGGHLRGRALQEWNLLSTPGKATFATAVKSLSSRIDAGCKAVAAQDFRHLQQRDSEPVSDLIRCLDRTFRIAYGRDSKSTETRDALLYAQLQEALQYELMRAPEVSGCTKYQELCVAAKNEEKRLIWPSCARDSSTRRLPHQLRNPNRPVSLAGVCDQSRLCHLQSPLRLLPTDPPKLEGVTIVRRSAM